MLALCLAATLSAATPSAAAAWRWPLRGPVVAAFHVTANPYARGQHRGIDIAAPVGTAVRAVCPGRVRFAGALPDGTGAISVACEAVTATYLQVRGLAVRPGAHVAAGTLLASVAASQDGREPRPHLYLGARVDGGVRPRYLDPLTLLSAPGPRPLAPFRQGRRFRVPAPRAPATPPASPIPVAVPPAAAPEPVPVPPRIPLLAWIGLALMAAGVPVGTLALRRRRTRRRATLVVPEHT
jgi:murein DD-endopeptidase MepM/ murein hydrolase activator NlpD